MPAGDKNTFVGQFYEHATHEILGGELTRNENGDICLWEMDTTVEVKGSGYQSSYGFRLSLNQIEHYERISVFPFDWGLYTFFSYNNSSKKNRKTGKSSSGLSKHTEAPAVHRYLEASTLWCAVLDLSIVSRWKAVKTHSSMSILGHPGVPTVDIKCREVHEISHNWLVPKLKALELDPAEFSVLSGGVRVSFSPDLFNHYALEFPFSAVILKSRARRVQCELRRRGFDLRRKDV